MQKIRFLVLGGAVLALGVLAMGPASAAPRSGLTISFFQGGSGTSGWSTARSNDPDPYSIEFGVPDQSSYAGVDFHHISAQLPDTAPSFEFYETGTPSGGSPRLVIASTDGCFATEYANPQTTDTWLTAGQWDVYGSCPFGYNVGWSGVQTAFSSRTVGSAYVVDDTYQTSGHTDWVDNIQYDGKVISQPSDNANK